MARPAAPPLMYSSACDPHSQTSKIYGGGPCRRKVRRTPTGPRARARVRSDTRFDAAAPGLFDGAWGRTSGPWAKALSARDGRLIRRNACPRAHGDGRPPGASARDGGRRGRGHAAPPGGRRSGHGSVRRSLSARRGAASNSAPLAHRAGAPPLTRRIMAKKHNLIQRPWGGGGGIPFRWSTAAASHPGGRP